MQHGQDQGVEGSVTDNRNCSYLGKDAAFEQLPGMPPCGRAASALGTSGRPSATLNMHPPTTRRLWPQAALQLDVLGRTVPVTCDLSVFARRADRMLIPVHVFHISTYTSAKPRRCACALSSPVLPHTSLLASLIQSSRGTRTAAQAWTHSVGPRLAPGVKRNRWRSDLVPQRASRQQ